ncbi:hypothetical protein CLOP_g17002, partial [Closterium sp. NIES-67]
CTSKTIVAAIPPASQTAIASSNLHGIS